MKYQKKIFIFLLSLLALEKDCAGERFINLGLTNILDGGSIRAHPGWYFQEIIQFYTTHKFLDANGNLFNGLPSPEFNSLAFLSQVIYESEHRILNGRLGFQGYIPFFAYAHLEKNMIGLTNSGGGLSDSGAGIFLQWDPIFYKDRAIFINRLSFDVGFPTGKNKEPKKSINPGSGFYFINPYWAASVYPTANCAVSWRLFYTWNATNKKTHRRLGDSLHMNFDAVVQPYPQLWVGCVGYFLQQIRDSTVCGIKVPHNSERVLGIGPGVLYNCPAEVDLFGFLYFETKVRNRSEGIKCIFRLIKHF